MVFRPTADDDHRHLAHADAGREYKLQRALAGVLDRYEFIVMDAPPSFWAAEPQRA